MLVTLAASLAAFVIVSVRGKDLYQSQKTILCPRVDSRVSRGSDSVEIAKKNRVSVAEAPIIKRIDTRKVSLKPEDVNSPSSRLNSSDLSGDMYKENGERQLQRRVLAVGRCSSVGSDNALYKRVIGSVIKNNGVKNTTADLDNRVVDASTTPFTFFDSGWATERVLPLTVAQRPKYAIGMRQTFPIPYCSIVPQPSVFRVMGNLLASLRLLLINQRPPYSENPLALFCMATLSAIPLFVVRFASLPPIMDLLRKRWAFQGECGDFTVEEVLSGMITVLTAESALKLALRAWFYGRNVHWDVMLPTKLSNLGRGLSHYFSFIPRAISILGGGILGGYWNAEVLHGVVHVLVHAAVFARLALFTAVQHAFFKENYHTAAFLLSPVVSQLASAVTALMCAISSAASLGTMLIFKNFANAVDVEHLLDSTGFRTTESQAAATSYLRNALHNIPKFFKSDHFDMLVQLTYYHDYLVRLVPRGIEWPLLLLHFSMALNSNSAAGLYLAVVNLVYAVVNQRLSTYERSILTRDIDEIVQESH
ncbi:uncharacterized protein BXIN_2775 [Babesia sp. Xinjiang]|uniref:uncharacterized protein n=1 Tax=Babesia sp. Xinjiang TaxID=462227 RepID=UPI000A2179A1|nr:uncharacterized protein BXIN_2775 [Babesia sp. Xinjiang]ORM41723.1 hypothetical protein BXIN_2775 [Babesia sp. Xinjiang]